jgi:polyhydroxybutyrate depolymerase
MGRVALGLSSRLVALVLVLGALASIAPPGGRSLVATQVALAADSDPVPSPGCGVSQVGAVSKEQHTLDIDGTDRWFLLTTPTAHDGQTPLPLVLDFHGLGEGAQIHTLMSEAGDFAEEEGFVVAFPHGQFDPVRWDLTAPPAPNQDLDFVDAILETLGNELCIDEARVYAMGLSFGAFMTSFLTCHRTDRFAAVAMVAGIRAFTNCPQTRSLPILAFHGTVDTFVPFNSGGGPVDLHGSGIPANVETWASRNGCEPSGTDSPITAEVVRRVYDCPDGLDVEFLIILGGGHAWPGSAFSQAVAAVVGYTTFDIHATQEAWRFFERFRLPCEPDPDCEADPVDDPSADPADDLSSRGATGAVSPVAIVAPGIATPAVVTPGSPSFTG